MKTDSDVPSLRSALRWYFSHVYARTEGPAHLPFYCDPRRVGVFAVAPDDLASGDSGAVFRLFVTLSMYQALRDVVIMRQQRLSTRAAMTTVADSRSLQRSIAENACSVLRSQEEFDDYCDVSKNGGRVDCAIRPGARCHVKDATVTFNRMGDMGKLPTSAWLGLWKEPGLHAVLADVRKQETAPAKRAALLVERFSQVHRVGRKLATLFVSALSTPALAPGLTPWFPEIDGNDLVVVDTNVARAVDILCKPSAPKTYEARQRWVRGQAAHFDLREFRPDLPQYSPRLVQQALYTFCSRSNRVAREDTCAERTTPCDLCAPTLCPFSVAQDEAGQARREAITASVDTVHPLAKG